MNTDYINILIEEFERAAKPERAVQMKAYMRNQFDYLGIASPIRKEIQVPFLVKAALPPKSELNNMAKHLWQLPHREYKYFTLELLMKYRKSLSKEDLKLYEYLALHDSWWDTIDSIAPNLMSAYFKQHPNEIKKQINIWLDSNNIWLQRCCVLFQLKYKKDVDTQMLDYVINRLLGSKEFFINKAIGWMLREFSRTDAKWVLDFAERTDLAPLSRREGLRLVVRG